MGANDQEVLVPIPKIVPLRDSAIVMKINDADTTGVKGFIHVPFNCYITGYSVLADVACALTIDIWKDTFANFPPLVADTIIDTGSGGVKPALAAAQGVYSTDIDHWTTLLSINDVIAFDVEATDGIVTEITITLFVKKLL